MTNNYTEQIASILNGKIDIRKISDEVIQIMLEEHPYSPYGHLVNYLKAKSTDRTDANELLNKLAIYSPDRAWLQQVLSTDFKDIEFRQASNQSIPSEAKNPNVDQYLFEFDFHPPSSTTSEVEIMEDVLPEEIAPFVQEEGNVDEELLPTIKVKPVDESGSYISWLQSFGTEEIESINEPNKEPVSSSERITIKNPVSEKNTRSDDDLFGGIITQTLAQLLANQGQTEKAINMYEQLSLIFPNKSAFFAAKIEQLKNNTI